MRDQYYRVVNHKGHSWLKFVAMALSLVTQRDKCLSVCVKVLKEPQEHAMVYATTLQSHIVQQGTLLT